VLLEFESQMFAFVSNYEGDGNYLS